MMRRRDGWLTARRVSIQVTRRTLGGRRSLAQEFLYNSLAVSVRMGVGTNTARTFTVRQSPGRAPLVRVILRRTKNLAPGRSQGSAVARTSACILWTWITKNIATLA